MPLGPGGSPYERALAGKAGAFLDEARELLGLWLEELKAGRARGLGHRKTN